MTLLAIFFALLFVYSLVSARVERTVFTAPILFTAAGIIVLFVLPEFRMGRGNLEWVRRIAEAGLVLLLFTDASRTDLNILNHIRNLPVRLLSIGMLLTLLLGALAALAVLPQFTIWEAGILAAILAPTDAGLGQIIVNSPQVPMCVRQALNVEAGLNDGLSVPFLLFFMNLAARRGHTRAGRIAHRSRRNGDRRPEHFRSRLQRSARHEPVRRQSRFAEGRITRTPGNLSGAGSRPCLTKV